MPSDRSTTRAGAPTTGSAAASTYWPATRTPECLAADERIPVGCAPCPVRDVCGGGLITHRWSSGNRFLNPSVHSPAIRMVVEHIRDIVRGSRNGLLPYRGMLRVGIAAWRW